jgi:hypothetical protein
MKNDGHLRPLFTVLRISQSRGVHSIVLHDFISIDPIKILPTLPFPLR